MECPDCGYAMTPFDKECPRCRNTRSRNEHRVNPYVAHQERLTHETQAAGETSPPAGVTDPVEPRTCWQVGLLPPADVSPRPVHDYVEPGYTEPGSPAPDAHGSWAADGGPRVAPIPPLTLGGPATAQPAGAGSASETAPRPNVALISVMWALTALHYAVIVPANGNITLVFGSFFVLGIPSTILGIILAFSKSKTDRINGIIKLVLMVLSLIAIVLSFMAAWSGSQSPD